MITAPVPVPAGPPLPDSNSDEPTFDTLYENFNTWEKNDLQPGMNALATNVYVNAVETAANAALAAANALQAISAAGVTLWVRDTNYTAGISYVVSPITLKTYQRRVTGSGAMDPSLDPANWLDTTPAAPVGSTLFLATNFGGF